MIAFLRRTGALALALLLSCPLLFAQSPPPELTLGRDWLLAQVQVSGDVSGSGGSVATPAQLRAEVLETLQRLGHRPAALVTRVENDSPRSEVEHLARALTTLARAGRPVSAALSELRSFQNADGGFGGTQGSSVLDTSLALLAFRSAGLTQDSGISRAVDFLVQSVQGAPSRSWHASTHAAPYITAYRLLALQTYAPAFSIGDALNAARIDLLAQRQNQHYLETLLDAVGAIALGYGTTSDGDVTALRTAIIAAQLANGSWNEDPFLTAMALRALDSGNNAPTPTSARVTARIRERGTAEALIGATLTLNGSASPYSAVSGSTGNVEIDGIVPGSYSASIVREGFDRVDIPAFTVNAGLAFDLGTIAMDRSSTLSALIGQVSDVTSGNPIANATLTLSGAASAQISSGPDGRYAFYSTSAGAVDVTVSKPGYQSVSAQGSLVLGANTRFSPALYPEGVGIPNSAILIGRVVDDASGEVLSGVAVVVASTSVMSTDDGRFRLTDLATGAFSAAINKSGYTPMTLTGTLAAGVNDTGTIRLTMAASSNSSTLSGTVRDAQSGSALANATISITGTNLRATTDAQGRYRINSITELPFEASASAPGFASARIVSGQNGHSNFEADFALERLAASDVVLESVAMNAPAFDPFTEAGLLATVRNNGSSEAGLIFHALLVDSTQQVILDVPEVQRNANTPFEATIKRVPAGQAVNVVITWPTIDHAAGDYSVLLRGESPTGQVMLEGSTSYRMNALKRLGGSVITDPPLLQAGTGQTVHIDGRLANMGNVPISAGDARLEVTLVAADNRPPLPPPALVQTDLLSGTPLNSPRGAARDAQGNVYTLNNSNRQLIKVATDGSSAVLTTVPQYTSGATPQWLGYPVGIGILPSGNLRIVGNAGNWVADVMLAPPYTVTYTQVPTATNTAYLVDGAGNEYFAGIYQGRTGLIRQTPDSQISVLAEAGFTAPSNAAISPDGNVFVALAATGRIMRVDAQTGAITLFASAVGSVTAIAFDASGALHTINSSNGELRRYDGNGVSTLVSGGLQECVDLQLGLEGDFYALTSTGSLWRINASGQKTLFAQGLASNFTWLSMDNEGGVYQASPRDAFHRAVNQHPIVRYSSFGITGIAARPNGTLWLNDSGILYSVSAIGTRSTLYSNSLISLTTLYSDSTETLVTAVRRDSVSGTATSSVDRFDNGTLTTLYRPPFMVAAPKLLALPDGGALTLSASQLSKVNRDGSSQAISTLRSAVAMGLRSNSHIAVYDNFEKLISIDPTTGAKTSLGVVNAFLTDIAQSSIADELVYVESNGRTLRKFAISTANDSLIATLPAGNIPNQLVVRTAQNDALISTSGQRLFRWDGSTFADLGYNDIAALFADEQGNAVVRRSDKLYWLDAAGVAGPARPLVNAFIPTTAYFDRDVAQVEDYRVNFRDPSNALIGRVESVAAFTSFGRFGNGDIAIFDNTNKRITRWNGNVLAALPGGFNDVVAMTSHNGEIFVTRSGGVHRIGADGSSTLIYAHPGWSSGEYGYLAFQPGGNRLTISSAWTNEVVIVENGARIDGFSQLSGARALAPRNDGSWWVQTTSYLIRVAADGVASSIVTRSNGIQDLSRDTQGRILAVTGDQSSGLQLLGDNGALSTLASTRIAEATGTLTRLISGAAGTYVLSNEGRVYRHQGLWLEHHASGIAAANGIAVTAQGSVLVSDQQNSSISRIADGKVDLIATFYEEPLGLCAVNDHQIVVSSNSHAFVTGLDGRWSTSNLGYTGAAGLLCDNAGGIVIVDEHNHRIRRLQIGTLPAPTPVGTVVHSATRSHTAIGLSAHQTIDFGSWTPQQGGDYLLSITSLDNSVTGALSTGLHVGPAAKGLMGVTPTRTVPRQTEVRVRNALEGADFTSLARIEPGQITQLGDFSVNPSAFGVTPSGGYWYTALTLHHASGIDMPPQQIGTDHYTQMRGDIPVDALGRAYLLGHAGASGFQLMRVSPSGVRELIAPVSTTSTGLALDADNNVYVLQSDRITRVDANGSSSLYALLPAGFVPVNLTRNGAGTLYVLGNQQKLLRIGSDRVPVPILRDIGFEYETGSINIAGDCADNLLVTPASMPVLGQSGEEYTVVQLIGATSEIGTVLNGSLVSQNLIDMDRITYDRFSSALIVWEHSVSRLFRLPITCGSIDIDYHVIVDAGQTITAAQPAPAEQHALPDGAVEYVWSLREVSALGTNIAFNTTLSDLRRGEDRPVAREAFLRLGNSFQTGEVRVPVAVPTVHVDELADIEVRTDRSDYAPHSAVDIDVTVSNGDAFSKQAKLRVRVVDSTQAVIATLVERPQTLGANEQLILDPPFNTEALSPGAYRIVAELLADDGEVLASNEASFTITLGNGNAPVLSATLASDRATYTTGGNVTLHATLRNLLRNQALTGLTLSERVVSGSGTEIFSASRNIPNLAADTEQRFEFSFALTDVAAGDYDAMQEVRDAQGALLDGRSTRFNVRGLSGPEAVSGSLSLASPLRRGNTLLVNAEVRNRSDINLAGVQIRVAVLDPTTGNDIAQNERSSDIAIGGLDSSQQSFDSTGWPLRDLVTVLRARIDGEQRVLAQQAFRVEDIELQGSVSATPPEPRRGSDVTIGVSARNIGNLAATSVVLDLKIENVTTGSQVASWQYTQPLAVNGSIDRSETQTTQTLPIGSYRAIWSASYENRSLVLAQRDFIVRDIIVSGSIQVDPSSAQSGTPFAIDAMVQNSGNLASDAFPVRVDVVRVDTGVVQQTWTEPLTLSAGEQRHVLRQFASDNASAGGYAAVVSAQLNGNWVEFARAPFTIARTPANVSVQLEVPRDTRVLVLMSCSAAQATETIVPDRSLDTAAISCEGFKDGFEGPAIGPSADRCEDARSLFLSEYLDTRGISHKIVHTQSDFMREMRCGRYNGFWLSGGARKLGAAETNELREGVYRGEALILDGNEAARNPAIDTVLGIQYVAPNASANLVHRGTGTLFPAVDLPSYGGSLRYSLTTGQIESSFVGISAPAIVSSSYGQGRTLAYAFDLVASLQRDGSQPAVERLLENALVHVAPTQAPPDYAIGAYVPVSTVIANQGQSADLKLRMAVAAPALVERSSPVTQSSDAGSSTWEFSLPSATTRSFDMDLRLPRNTATLALDSDLAQRFGNSLEPLSNRTLSLSTANADSARAALEASLQAATLTPVEQAARSRALTAITAASNLMQGGQAEAAISKWIEAATEVTSITSVSHSAWRLAIARLLEHAQRTVCRSGVAMCGTSTSTPLRFDDATFASRNGNGFSLIAQGGGPDTWEWSLAADARAGNAAHIDVDWTTQQPIRFVAEIHADGSAQMQLFNGANPIGSTSYPAGTHPIQLGSAVQLIAMSPGGISTTTRIRLSNLRINGIAVPDEVGTLPSSLRQQSVLSLYLPALSQGATIEGNVTLDFAGCWPPGGPDYNIGIRFGGVACNGGVQ